MKKSISLTLSLCLFLSLVGTTACTNTSEANTLRSGVLRVASWDEYIDMGGDYLDAEEDAEYIAWYKEQTGIDLLDSKPLYEEFEKWYAEKTGEKITVEYVALQDNETMYNKIKMGDKYDLLCPSEYMAMKLKAEDYLIAYPESFYDATIEENAYAKNVSAYPTEVFEKANLSGYIAGYMWGTTGFVYNPNKIGNSPEEARKIMSSWKCLTNEACRHKLTAKDNTRDSYFMGLGMYYEDKLLALDSDDENYGTKLTAAMNDTSVKTMSEVKQLLIKARKNLYGLETDEGKTDVIMGRLDASFQWSGDAVYILDEAETASGLELEYSIPLSASNIWFDGWVMMKGANVKAATAFVNFLSDTKNAVRNMYFIGYTSCLAGKQMYDYADFTYGASDEDDAETVVEYDFSYFFGDDYPTLLVPEEQTRRQLFAQYPDTQTKKRLVVMDYFDEEENERANRMWNNIK